MSDASENPENLCHVVNSNIAIDTLPSLQISLGIVALFEKIYDGEPIPNPSNIGEDLYNTVVSIKCMMGKARHYADIGEQLLISNYRNRVR
jgi:hypothetical protein